MRTWIGAGALALAALAGCGEVEAPSADQNAAVSQGDFQNQVAALPEGQRNGVFIRAIRDAGEECQHVERSERAGEHQGLPVWTAYCAEGSRWTIVVTNDGSATVFNADEARLPTDNEAAPAKAEGQ